MKPQQDAKSETLSAVKSALLDLWRSGATIRDGAAQITRRSSRGSIPLSLAQERIWFIEQFQPGTPAYNLSFCSRIEGRLDPDILSQSLTDLVERHEILRTTVVVDQDSPIQLVDRSPRPHLDFMDLQDYNDDDALAMAIQRIDAATQKRFQLESDPLARVILCTTRSHSILGIVVHHLVADGWSLGLALRELSDSYQARACNQSPVFSPLPIQYGDFAVWQREHLREDMWERDIAYWREALSDLSPLELPTDQSRPSVITPRGDWRKIRLSQQLSEAIRELARNHNATVFMVVLAAFNVLLYKLTGQSDLTVGTAIAGRVHPETFALIGNFINMLTLRTNVSGDPTFAEVLQRTRDTCLGAFAHQHAPFERVVAQLQPERDLSRSVLFQVLLVLQPPVEIQRFAGSLMQLIELGPRSARADLEIHLRDQPEISGRVAFSTDLFDPQTVERLIERLQIVLEEMVANPECHVSNCSIVLAEEQRMLDAWGRGNEPEIPPVGVHQMIEQQAAIRSDATAVVFQESGLAYRELNSKANQLAHYLGSLGVGPEVKVGVFLERSVEMVVALVAVLKAGGAYVPLDPHYPAERLALITRDAQVTVLVSQQKLAQNVAAPDARLVCLDTDRDTIDTSPDHNPPSRVRPDNLAYVIYTSGSTGVPKGVQITHRALTNLVLSMIERPGLTADDVQVSVASPSFDASVGEFFPVLAAGATLVIAPPEALVDGDRLRKLLQESRSTALQATATTWLLPSSSPLGSRRMRALCGGEPTPPPLAESLAKMYDQAWNMYGPTEATVWASAHRLESGASVSLGRPLNNTRLYVVDEDLQRVPIGVAGELCIGGAGLSRGYIRSAGLTAGRFIPDPFTPDTGARLYRTGDLARFRPNGTLEFLGRRDHQIKLRGHRIELEEIEAILSLHTGVDRAVATVRGVSTNDTRLVAYISPPPADGECTQFVSDLRRHLRRYVPDYMTPSEFIFLQSLPTTPTGKVDRRCLPCASGHSVVDSTSIVPRTPLECEVASVAAQVLGLERIGIRDDFFSAGGHSLTAARLVAHLRTKYQVELLLEELFQAPTVERLAATIERELNRKLHLRNQDARLRRTVEQLPEQAVDGLIRQLLSEKNEKLTAGTQEA